MDFPEGGNKQIFLVAEDDPNDVFFLNLAFARHGARDVSLRFVDDGRQTMDYLLGEGQFTQRRAPSTPSLLVVDLEMPRFNGIELLEWLNGHRDLIDFPVVVLTGAVSDFQYRESTRFDFVTAFLIKSERFDHLPSLLGQIRTSWLERRN